MENNLVNLDNNLENNVQVENFGKRFAIYTLGCKVNQEESVAIANVFKEHDYEQVDFSDIADIYIVNTCTVTHVADKKSRNILRRAVQKNPDAFIAVTGCYTQTGKEDLAKIEGIDLILGANQKSQLFQLVTEAAVTESERKYTQILVNEGRMPQKYEEIGNVNSDTNRERAYVKIQDGCNQFCSYCIVPYARGPVRSRPLEAVLAEVSQLVSKGYKEVVLAGIHTGSYGSDVGTETSFTDLVRAVSEVSGLHRLRLGSVEPHEVSDELIDLMATSSVICPHFHIPLQAGNSVTLKAMKRCYDAEFYMNLVEKIRAKVKNVMITTDIIVGFPGESDDDFAVALANIRKFGFADAHIFPYSKREGTPAAKLPNQLSNEVKNQRSGQLAELISATRKSCLESLVGSEIEVLLEQVHEENGEVGMMGHTANFAPVFVVGANHATSKLLNVTILKYENEVLVAQV